MFWCFSFGALWTMLDSWLCRSPDSHEGAQPFRPSFALPLGCYSSLWPKTNSLRPLSGWPENDFHPIVARRFSWRIFGNIGAREIRTQITLASEWFFRASTARVCVLWQRDQESWWGRGRKKSTGHSYKRQKIAVLWFRRARSRPC